jgi:hypothetical protein
VNRIEDAFHLTDFFGRSASRLPDDAALEACTNAKTEGEREASVCLDLEFGMKRRLLLCGVLLALSVGIMPAGADSTPSIVGEFVQHVSQTMGHVGFRYYCANQRCKAWTEWGKSSNLSDAVKTTEQDELRHGQGMQTYDYNLHGLTPGTVYYFRGVLKYFTDDSHTKTATLYTKIGFLRTAPIPTPPPTPVVSKHPTASLSANMSATAVHLNLHCDTAFYSGQCIIFWSTSAKMAGGVLHRLESKTVTPTPGGITLNGTFPASKVADRTNVYFQGVMKLRRMGIDDLIIETPVKGFLIRSVPL